MNKAEFESTIVTEALLPVIGRSAIVTKQTEQGSIGVEIFKDGMGQMSVFPIGKELDGYESFKDQAIIGGIKALNIHPEPSFKEITSITPC